MRSADRSFGASKKPERDAVALSRHMILKGNKPDWPYVYATSARRNEQVTYVQTRVMHTAGVRHPLSEILSHAAAALDGGRVGPCHGHDRGR